MEFVIVGGEHPSCLANPVAKKAGLQKVQITVVSAGSTTAMFNAY